MLTTCFYGRVLPDIGLTILGGNPSELTWKPSSTGLEMRATIRVVKSKIEIECHSNRVEEADKSVLITHALKFAKALVDAAAFERGIGQTAVLEKIVEPDGKELTAFISDPKLRNLCTIPTTELIEMIATDNQLCRALSELTGTLERPFAILTDCARGVERLGHMIAPRKKKEDRWNSLRQKLNLSERYLRSTTDLATGPRHGDPDSPAGDELFRNARYQA